MATHQEDWTALDGLYFTVATFTTVGYGDFGPLTTGGRYVADVADMMLPIN